MNCDLIHFAPETECDHIANTLMLKDCIESTQNTLENLGIYDNTYSLMEHDFIMMRCEILPNIEKYGKLEVCFNHRNNQGWFYFLNNIKQ